MSIRKFNSLKTKKLQKQAGATVSFSSDGKLHVGKKTTTGRARSLQYKRLEEISQRIKAIEQERSKLQIPRTRLKRGDMFGVSNAETFLHPKYKAEEHIAALWKEQAKLAKEYVELLKDEELKKGYGRWVKKKISRGANSTTSRKKVEWSGTLKELSNHLVKQYKEGKYRSKVDASEGGSKEYTYKGKRIKKDVLYQYMKGK